MPSKNKQKGQRLEYKVRDDLKTWYKGCSTTALKSRALDLSGIDLCNIPFHVQCKNVESIKHFDIFQMEENMLTCLPKYFVDEELEMNKRKPFVLVHRKKRKHVEVKMTYESFIKLLKILNDKLEKQ